MSAGRLGRRVFSLASAVADGGVSAVARYTRGIAEGRAPGVTIPDPVRERMRLAGERVIAGGIAQAREFLAEPEKYVQGTRISWDLSTNVVRDLLPNRVG